MYHYSRISGSSKVFGLRLIIMYNMLYIRQDIIGYTGLVAQPPELVAQGTELVAQTPELVGHTLELVSHTPL